MIFILINQIDIEFFRLKLALKLVSLVQCVVKLIFTIDALGCPKELLHHIGVNFSFQYLLNLTGTILALHKARVAAVWFHHFRWHLMYLPATQVFTLVFYLR
jgi:hypothetical protein